MDAVLHFCEIGNLAIGGEACSFIPSDVIAAKLPQKQFAAQVFFRGFCCKNPFPASEAG